jgi:hypothetical protein
VSGKDAAVNAASGISIESPGIVSIKGSNIKN